jgi:hypothetical protein
VQHLPRLGGRPALAEPIGGAARLDAEVREPVTKHTLTLMQRERWLQWAVTNPAEKVRKERPKALLG